MKRHTNFTVRENFQDEHKKLDLIIGICLQVLINCRIDKKVLFMVFLKKNMNICGNEIFSNCLTIREIAEFVSERVWCWIVHIKSIMRNFLFNNDNIDIEQLEIIKL